MREYLSESNLRKALLLSAVATAMSAPRILVSGFPFWILLLEAFIGLSFISGTITAWGRRAGMAGVAPEHKKVLKGLGLAVVLAVFAALIGILWLDPVFYRAYAATGDQRLLQLQYPESPFRILALILWAASFETFFFGAGTMSFLARLFNRQSVAIAGAVTFRLAIACYQLSHAGIVNEFFLFVGSYGVALTVVCWLFARYGLPAAVVFVGLANLRLFFV